MNITFNQIEPHNLLRPYLDKIWVFESNGKLPNHDLKLVVPNGNLKLTINTCNGIRASINGQSVTAPEGGIILTGLMDTPITLDTDQDTFTKTIGIEFNPKGAYRFFPLHLQGIKSQIVPIHDVINGLEKELEPVLDPSLAVLQQIDLVQKYLLKRLMASQGDLIFEYCVDRIISTKGNITVKALEQKTGYSSRWLHMKFLEKVGISPKGLASIIRFRTCYQNFLVGDLNDFFKDEFYSYFHDQSHYLKNFKQFTGFAPSGIELRSNDFGRKFYHS